MVDAPAPRYRTVSVLGRSHERGCLACADRRGDPDRDAELHAHHVVNIGSHDPSNLITLCRDCHVATRHDSVKHRHTARPRLANDQRTPQPSRNPRCRADNGGFTSPCWCFPRDGERRRLDLLAAGLAWASQSVLRGARSVSGPLSNDRRDRLRGQLSRVWLSRDSSSDF